MKSAEITKISAAFYAPMFTSFERQLDEAFIKRDAFLDHVIASEIPHIRSDLKGKRNSIKAKRYIGDQLRKIGGGDARTPVSIKVRHSTAQALRELEETHNLVRDAVLNRIITMLRASDKLLSVLELPPRISALMWEGYEDMPVGPIRAVVETLADPFYYMRAACEMEHRCGIYALPLPEQLHGLSCYMSDGEVPGTSANKRLVRDTDRMLEELALFESNLVKRPVAKKGGRRG